MTTQAQILANRSNAQKSTGPRTPEGKAVVAQNAVKHGLCGRETVIQGEDPGEFEFYRERMLAELDPVGEIESDLADRIVDLSWRLKRAGRLQAAAFDSLLARQVHSVSEQFDKKQDADGGSTLGRALVRDFGGGRVLDRLLMYERRIEHSLYRTMAELKRHRILSEVGPGKMWELRRALEREEEPEKVSSLKCEVSSGEERAPSTSTVASNLKLDTSNLLSDGTSANVTVDVQGGDSSLDLPPSTLETSKTKPLCPAPDDGQVLAEPGVNTISPVSGAAETKPIPDADGGVDRIWLPSADQRTARGLSTGSSSS